ncbi:hypothetical protein Q5424_26010 [Conexibacter sp. JD483]|uniref:hypothetical protein n=1 Tax=unclassified Conexibacter TaxID=2627773 RepID=UPI0027158DD5|nr:MULTISPECIES: hypothetical protein [unclassified Conexibacter]MDO8189276.1 hypothetical protein [Conexibacter sp. CPCC 205706]MDO8201954.1 hypothetical protein [Conexibacter sp. CPCC 205762]MDR9372581.1 hypothetical protein [Conexibacter sp. JD483]
MNVVYAKLVDWDLLGEAVAASFVIGIAVLVIAGVAVAASLRAQDQRAAGAEGGVIGWSALTVVCVLAIAGAIAAGIWVMAQ